MKTNNRKINRVGTEQQVARYKSLKIKGKSRLAALKVVTSMIDLTTLEGSDNASVVSNLCHQARYAYRDEETNDLAHTAAVCVYPRWVATAVSALQKIEEQQGGAQSPVHVAAVATYFPSGQVGDENRTNDIAEAVAAGAKEIDIVINRGEFLAGNYDVVSEQIRRAREIAKDVKLKVILETGELKDLDKIRYASKLAIDAGANFIKTSTGKIKPGATMGASLVMLQVIRDHYHETGIKIGMKPAGGIRTADDALAYLVMVDEVLGAEWLTPDLFRFGASSLLNNVVNEIRSFQG